MTKVYENKNNPINSCIHCGSKWTSNSPSHTAKHLYNCPKIPKLLWERFQSYRLYNEQAPEIAPHMRSQESQQGKEATKPSKLNDFVDIFSASEQTALNEALAEWIHGSGLISNSLIPRNISLFNSLPAVRPPLAF